MSLTRTPHPKISVDKVYGTKNRNSSLVFRKLKEEEQKMDLDQYYKEFSMITPQVITVKS